MTAVFLLIAATTVLSALAVVVSCLAWAEARDARKARLMPLMPEPEQTTARHIAGGRRE